MRKTLQMISVLTFVGFISGAMLVFVYKYADPRIVLNQKNETEKAVFQIFPQGEKYDKETMNKEDIFKVQDKNGRLLGYAFLAEGNGYQGTIKMMVGIEPDLETLRGIVILESQETPGLGQEITQNEFKSQFIGLKTTPEITYVKNKKPSASGEIEAITGATVSSSAVVSILNAKIETVKTYLKGK